MRSLPPRLIVISIILLGVCIPVSAVTIQPGVYTLEWKVPKADGDVYFAGRAGANMSAVDAQKAVEIKGLVSTRPYSCETDRFRIVLDESKGTGSGWDVAYITRVVESGIDKAVKIPLKQDYNTLKPSSPTGALIDIAIGIDGTQSTRRAALGLEVYLEADQDGELHPSLAMLTLRGGWYGRVATDEGELAVQSVDFNENFIYGDELVVDPASKLPVMGDAVVFGDSPREFEDCGNVVYLGSVVSYDGSLYECSVSPTGETLEIKAYTGETGVLSFDPRDGFGKQAVCRRAVVYAHAGVFSSGEGSEITVPPGDYRCLTSLVLPAKSEAGSDALSVVVQRKSPVTLEANARAVMRLGGPVDVVVDQESDIIELKAGGSKTIKLSFQVGEDALVGLEGTCKAWVNIRNEKGKLLSSDGVEVGQNGACDYCIQVPSDWKPGTYSFGVAFESALYQKPTYAHKMLRVGK